MNQQKEIIGILGGMGPEASAKMLEVTVTMSAREFGAKTNQDFPEIILFSVPVPDFITDKKNINKAKAILKQKVRVMRKIGVSTIAIACNTAHILIDDFRLISNIRFVSIIDAVADDVKRNGIKSIAILGTPVTLESGLFQNALLIRNIEPIIPNKKKIRIIDGIIRRVIRNKLSTEDCQKLKIIAKSLKKRGAQGVILGCTELPLVFPKKLSIPIFDSIEITSRVLLTKHFVSIKKGITIN
ncbi:hypothetical protein A2165_00185 [Candidatus Curtissbacteria bacterium RBG_13_40_7]|uniref:Aspartate racemase n=1 Tax=Candidatus Curtissbacteria bacterium RBG_13_40_7 TaxID=1797706 RepID=A0A1F5FYA0_9BACT|nr:MAG: hypothetical protein A2165_00185 [Candidatus Curtissbacteria bacterium RBG_13_40_7]